MTNEHTMDAATPTMDALFAVVMHALTPERRWMLEGWAAHLRLARHQNHAANSWARHRDEFASLHDLAQALTPGRNLAAGEIVAQALTLARIVDFGEKPDAAAALLFERVEARAAKVTAQLTAWPIAPQKVGPQKVLPRRSKPRPVQPSLPLHAAA